MAEKKKYLVHVELAEATLDRVKEAGAAVAEGLREISQGDVYPAYRSMGCDLFGFFVATSLAPAQIRAALNTPTFRARDPSTHYKASAFRAGDRVLIVDVGRDALSINKDDAARWLQRR